MNQYLEKFPSSSSVLCKHHYGLIINDTLSKTLLTSLETSKTTGATNTEYFIAGYGDREGKLLNNLKDC